MYCHPKNMVLKLEFEARSVADDTFDYYYFDVGGYSYCNEDCCVDYSYGYHCENYRYHLIKHRNYAFDLKGNK